MYGGVNTRLADGMTSWKVERIPERLNLESPVFAWQVQDLGDEEQQVCSEILREGTPLGGLQLCSFD